VGEKHSSTGPAGATAPVAARGRRGRFLIAGHGQHLIAAALVAAAALVRVPFESVLRQDVPFIFYFMSITIAATALNHGASFTALALSIPAAWFFTLGPATGHRVTVAHGLQLGLFLAAGGLIAVLGEGLHAATRRARAGQRLYRATFELVQAGVAHIDMRTGRFLRANPRLCGIVGRAPDELAKLSIADLARPEDQERNRQAGRELLSGRAQTVQVENRWKRSDGSEVIVEVAGRILRQRDAEPIVVVSVMDVSRLRRANEELEHFANIVGHDLKEPLRGIGLHLATIQEDSPLPAGSATAERLAAAQRLLRRAIEMLDALLAYARHGHTRAAECRLDSIVDEAVENLRARIQDRGAQVVRETPMPPAVCDRGRLLLVFQNLIGNALKYSRDDPPRVWIGARDGAIYVRDNGIGIPPQHQREIFEMFKRLHARDAYGGGAGAGLAIVRRIVESHGGRIWVESAPGEGATFWFTLGMLRAADSRPAGEARPAERAHPTVAERRK
jgi:PAS domain S-box-containing protein